MGSCYLRRRATKENCAPEQRPRRGEKPRYFRRFEGIKSNEGHASPPPHSKASFGPVESEIDLRHGLDLKLFSSHNFKSSFRFILHPKQNDKKTDDEPECREQGTTTKEFSVIRNANDPVAHPQPTFMQASAPKLSVPRPDALTLRSFSRWKGKVTAGRADSSLK